MICESIDDIRKALYEARIHRGYTRRALEDYTGIAESTIFDYETGRHQRGIKFSVLLDLLTAMDYSVIIDIKDSIDDQEEEHDTE